MGSLEHFYGIIGVYRKYPGAIEILLTNLHNKNQQIYLQLLEKNISKVRDAKISTFLYSQTPSRKRFLKRASILL